MPFCPKCLTEYVAGTTQCEDCGVTLLPGSPPEIEDEAESGGETGKESRGWFRFLIGAGPEEEGPPVKMVRVRVFSGGTASLDANVARKVLKARGIPSVLGGETSAEMLPFLEVSLLVREEDADTATEILHNYFDKTGPKLVE